MEERDGRCYLNSSPGRSLPLVSTRSLSLCVPSPLTSCYFRFFISFFSKAFTLLLVQIAKRSPRGFKNPLPLVPCLNSPNQGPEHSLNFFTTLRFLAFLLSDQACDWNSSHSQRNRKQRESIIGLVIEALRCWFSSASFSEPKARGDEFLGTLNFSRKQPNGNNSVFLFIRSSYHRHEVYTQFSMSWKKTIQWQKYSDDFLSRIYIYRASGKAGQ